MYCKSSRNFMILPNEKKILDESNNTEISNEDERTGHVYSEEEKSGKREDVEEHTRYMICHVYSEEVKGDRREDVNDDTRYSIDPVYSEEVKSEKSEGVEEDTSDEGDNTDNESLVQFERVDLQYGITMTIPKTIVHKVQNMCAKPWTVEKRFNNLPQTDTSIHNTEMFCSDLYELAYIDDTVTENRKDFDNFYVPGSSINDITITVPIENKEQGNWFDYEARISSNHSWKSVKANYLQNDDSQYVEFNANSIDSFCITRKPKKEICLIKKDGQTFTSKKDPLVQLLPNDHSGMKQRLRTHPEKFKILAMSDCLHVKQSVPKFQFPVSINVPIREQIEEDFEFVFIHFKGTKIQIIDKSSGRKLEKIHDLCTLSVDSFSGHIAALVRVGTKDINQEEIKMNMGLLKQCTILIFIHKTHKDFLTLWVEIVKIDEVEEKVSKRTSESELIELPLCRSPDVFLCDAQRIRISVSGIARFVKGRTHCSQTLTFLHTARNNYMSFPLEIKRQMDNQPFAIIDFFDDNNNKRRLYTAHFDPDQVKKRMARPFTAPAYRERSVLQISIPDNKTEPANDTDFFSDKSMMVLAAKLPSSEAHCLALKDCNLNVLADQVEKAFHERGKLEIEDLNNSFEN
ncbi:hypothetical protein KUTeg_012248, partial [Tegillarca granosa]